MKRSASQILSAIYNKKQIALYRANTMMIVSKHAQTTTSSFSFCSYLALRRERFDALLSASEPLSDILLTSESDIFPNIPLSNRFAMQTKGNSLHQCSLKTIFFTHFLYFLLELYGANVCIAVVNVKLHS